MLKQIPIFWKLSTAFIIIILLILAALNYVNIPNSATPRWHLQTVFVMVIAIILSYVSTWLLVSLYIKRPVRELVKGMNELAEKRFDYRLEENEKDEFGSLASSFNDMATMLSSSLRELEKTRDYLEGILESSADIIITINPTGKILTFNKGAEHILAYRRYDVIGKPIEILFVDPRDRDIVTQKLKYTDDVMNYENQLLTKDREVKDVLFTISRLRNPTGEVIGTIAIGKDITEQKRLQEQLMQSQRLAVIGQVFTGIQHSMKNMLNACKGGAYMVSTGLAKDNRTMLEEGWDMVQEGISRMTEMSSDMLKYVKEWKLKPDRVDLSQILNEIYRLIKQTAKDKGVEFQLNIPSGLPLVLCDARMVHSAVMDIVSNALDACLWKNYDDNEEPEVFIYAYTADDGQVLVIEVKDNGCGMTDKVKENIFTPFFSTKSKAGTGLGLSITSRMISVHDGKIEVESETDRGTVFRILLPVDGIDKTKENINGKKGSDS